MTDPRAVLAEPQTRSVLVTALVPTLPVTPPVAAVPTLTALLVDEGLTAGQLAGGAVLVLGLLGFVVGGVLAYRGSWARMRRRMVVDPEGHRMAGGLWLGLLGIPIAMFVFSDPAPDGAFSPVQWVAWVLMAVLLVAMIALALNRPAALTRVLTPRWLLREREQRFGTLRPDGRAARRL